MNMLRHYFLHPSDFSHRGDMLMVQVSAREGRNDKRGESFRARIHADDHSAISEESEGLIVALWETMNKLRHYFLHPSDFSHRGDMLMVQVSAREGRNDKRGRVIPSAHTRC